MNALEKSLLNSREKQDRAFAKIREIANAAPELGRWDAYNGCCGSMRLLQFHPGEGLVYNTLDSQTSALAIINATCSRGDARGDGSLEAYTADGWQLIFHRSLVTFTLQLPGKTP